ncbi:hypothetical protein [Butyrivibrio sp. INlla16]|nr:hypothetical protein [Butyrivibrio sp. INlla16]
MDADCKRFDRRVGGPEGSRVRSNIKKISVSVVIRGEILAEENS